MRKRISQSDLSNLKINLPQFEKIKVYPSYPYGKDVLMNENVKNTSVINNFSERKVPQNIESIDYSRIDHFSGNVFNVPSNDEDDEFKNDDNEEKYFFSLMEEAFK